MNEPNFKNNDQFEKNKEFTYFGNCFLHLRDKIEKSLQRNREPEKEVADHRYAQTKVHLLWAQTKNIHRRMTVRIDVLLRKWPQKYQCNCFIFTMLIWQHRREAKRGAKFKFQVWTRPCSETIIPTLRQN